MGSSADRDATALLVIDVQTNVVAGAHDRKDVIENIGSLVERARAARVPVVWVQHADDQLVAGSVGWEVVPELVPDPSEPVVHKHHGDAFEDTDLESVLASRGVGHVVVTGAQTDACIRSTIHGAFVRGYDTTLVSDAHTTEDLSAYGMPAPAAVIAHTNMYWSWQSGPGRTAAVVPTAEVDFV